MPNGPGKYDELTTEVREKSNARGAIVVVIEGDKGSGFSVQADAEILASLPAILENLAQEIRASAH